jgi:methylated-DNA-[protein]-cysteine S-methyltransferase
MEDRVRARETVIAATVVEAPWGPIHMAASERGVIAIELATTPDAFAEGLARRTGATVRWLAADAPEDGGGDLPAAVTRHLGSGRDAVSAALAGRDAALHALVLDLSDRPAWDRAVLGAVRTIPRGETRSYGDIARQVGKPGAARAVGGAVGRNPVALAIPCHRVIAGDGTIGGYGGGWWGDRERLLDLKTELLAGEGRIVRRRAPGRATGR